MPGSSCLRVWLVLGVAGLSSGGPAAAQEPDDLVVHGFASQGFIKSTANDYLAESERGSFEFAEAGLNVTKQLGSRLRFGAQLFARDLGPEGDYRVSFDWFYLDYRLFDWLGLRAGRTKLPFGLHNETSDIDAARIPILLPQSLYPTTQRDLLLAQTGLELYGFLSLGAAGGFDYRFYGGTIFVERPPFVPGPSPLVITDTGAPYVVGGRLLWETPLLGLRAGGSLQYLRLDIDFVAAPWLMPPPFMGPGKAKIPARLWVGSIDYQGERLGLTAEYGRWRAGRETSPMVVPNQTTISERLYAMATFHVTAWLTTGIYYARLVTDVEDCEEVFPWVSGCENRGAYQHDTAATLRFDVTPRWLIKLEGHFMRGTALLDPSLNDGVERQMLDENWVVLLAKTTAYF